MGFLEWMSSAGLSEKSANSYFGAIKGRLTTWALAHGLTKKPILEISDLYKFVTLAMLLRETPEFKLWNMTGHGMYAAALSNYQKYLLVLITQSDVKPSEHEPNQWQVSENESERIEPFDPRRQADARARVLREVVQRQGQAKFRKALITAYSGRCAITACPVTPLLEAAHITPYLGPDTNSITNGLLLRADLHTLWDLGLLAVAPDTETVWVSPQVNDPTYRVLEGANLTEPTNPDQRPSIAALLQQWCHAQAKLDESVLGA